MGKTINVLELKRQYEENPDVTISHLTEALDHGHLSYRDLSVRDMFEGICGSEALAAISYRKSGRRSITESASAVDQAAFSHITGQFLFTAMKEAFDGPEFLWPLLCDSQQTNNLFGERIPGVGGIGDRAEIVEEGKPFPSVGLNEEWLQTSALIKRGFKIAITREITIADKTGLVVQRAKDGGRWMSLNLEKRGLDEVFGVTNTYNRNGTATNTYLTSGAYVNQQTKSLTDWTSIEAAELLFDAMTDPNTGEPIVLGPNRMLIVPSALARTARRILQGSETAHVDNTVSSSTIRQFYPNPMTERLAGGKLVGGGYTAVSSPYVKARTGSATTWFFGEPKKAFKRMYAWDVESVEAPANHPDNFDKDIVTQHKFSEMSVFQTMEARYMAKNV